MHVLRVDSMIVLWSTLAGPSRRNARNRPLSSAADVPIPGGPMGNNSDGSEMDRALPALGRSPPSGGTIHVDRRHPLASADDHDVALGVTRIRLAVDGPGGNVDEVAAHRLHHRLPKKGYSFSLWWIFGAVLFIVALPMALVAKPNAEGMALRGEARQCPHCAELIKPEAKVCRYCGRDVSPVSPEQAVAGLTGHFVKCPRCGSSVREADKSQHRCR